MFLDGLLAERASDVDRYLSALDVDSRGLLQWEVQFPDPWPGTKPGDKDPRYDFLAQALEDFGFADERRSDKLMRRLRRLFHRAGPDADDAANNRLLLERLSGLTAAQRSARFRCVMVFQIGRASCRERV